MSLWLDEIWSVKNALKSPLEILLCQDPARSYPFHLVLHVFLKFGNNEFMARLPSAIFGILAIPLIYLLGKQLYNKNVGLLSAFMLTFWPFHVWYSQEARMYSLFLLATTASMLMFSRLLAKGGSKTWILYLIATVVGLYTHFYFVFVIGIQLLYAIYRQTWKPIAQFVDNPNATQTTIFIVSFISTLIIGIPFIDGALNMLETGPGLSIPWGLGWREFWIEVFSYLSIGLLGIFFAVPIFIVGLYYSLKRDHHDSGVLVGLWIFAPTLLLFILTLLLRPLTGDRYLIFCLPAYLIMLSHGLLVVAKKLKSKVPQRKQTFTAFYLATVIFGTLATPALLLMPLTLREDWRACVTFLNENVGDDDMVLVYPLYIERCLDYYKLDRTYEPYGTIDKTCARIVELNGTLWLVFYGWGDAKTYYESRVFPLGFEEVAMWYQIFIYKR